MQTLTEAASIYCEVHRLSSMKAFAVGCAAVLLLQAGVVAVIDTTSCTGKPRRVYAASAASREYSFSIDLFCLQVCLIVQDVYSGSFGNL